MPSDMRSLDTSARLSRDKDLDRIVERGFERTGSISKSQTNWPNHPMIGGLVVVVALVSAAFYWASSEIRVLGGTI